MKRMSKRFLSVLLTLIFVLSMTSYAFAAEDESAPSAETIELPAEISLTVEEVAAPSLPAEQNTAEAAGSDVPDSAAAEDGETGEAPADGNGDNDTPVDGTEDADALSGDGDAVNPDSEDVNEKSEGGSDDENGWYQNVATVTYAIETPANNGYDISDSNLVNAIKSVNILDSTITVKDLETGYSVLSYQFTDSTKTKTYELVLSGIETNYAKQYIPGTANYTDSEGYKAIQVLAYNFLNGKENGLKEEPNSPGIAAHNMIDAEKIATTTTNSDQELSKLADSQLCWAASASDMLWLTGWAQLAKDPVTNAQLFNSEDELFAYFKKYYADDGSLTEYGLKWFFDGINPDQEMNADGTVNYHGGNKGYISKTNNSQLILEDTSVTKDGFIEDVCAEFVVDAYQRRTTAQMDKALAENVEKLKDGDAVGIGAGNYVNDNGTDKRKGGHAITVMGYIKEIGENIVDALKGLFLADSDDCCEVTQTTPAIPADKRNNLYIYKPLSKIKLNNSDNLQSYKIDNYGSNFVIDSVITLKNDKLGSYTNEKLDAPNNTLTSSSTVDLVATNLRVLLPNGDPEASGTTWTSATKVELGDIVKLEFSLANMSYQAVDAKDNAKLVIKYSLFRDNETTPFETKSVEFDCNDGIGALSKPTATYNLRMKQPGTIRVEYEILGYKKYNPATGSVDLWQEAFLKNNKYDGSYSLVVTPSGGDDGGAGEDTTVPTVTVREIVPTYQASFNPAKGSDIVFKFGYDKVTDVSRFTGLFYNDQLVDPSNYTLVRNADGTFSITFSKDYLETFSAGSHTFYLMDGDVYLVFIIDII